MLDKLVPLLSRKYLIIQSGIIFAALVPLAHKWFQVSDAVTMATIGAIVSLGGAYGYFNVKDGQKDSPAPPPEPKL